MLLLSFIYCLIIVAKLGSSADHNRGFNVLPKQRKMGDNDFSIYSLSTSAANSKQIQERDMLYDAYNSLHTLAQEFKKPFDSPAVIIVGYQSSGKSALVEALMGFQFNQVGSGTKTRRPIALQMQYNANYATPVCFLTLDNGKEEQRSLEDIQSYIEAENKRLERDPTRAFDAREIKIRMEYRHCPNLLIIDTPGLIHAPKGRHLNPEQRAIAQQSREAEQLVLSKIRVKDYIIVCVEDVGDWKHATTRNLVSQVDPDLSRTVVVNPKLDTKLPQNSASEDVESFLTAPPIQSQFPHRLGGPFFTTIPAGRVGEGKEFDSNDAFVASVHQAEINDRSHVTSKLGFTRSAALLGCVGVSRLRTFLEQRVEECYRRNVDIILPKLKLEMEGAQSKLTAVEKELDALSLDKLASSANAYRENFAKQLALVVQGTVKLSPTEWGEDVRTEQEKGGSFLESPHNVELIGQVENAMNKLYGGAQYHRALNEFRRAVQLMPSPKVSADEIANAAGMGETSNGVNFMRAACVIAMEKAELSFDPMLEALRHRVVHIMRRLFPIVEIMVRQSYSGSSGNKQMDMLSRPFLDQVRRIFEQFIEQRADAAIDMCSNDLHGMIKYVTWDTDDRGFSQQTRGKGGMPLGEGVGAMPITPGRMVQIYNYAFEKQKRKKLVKTRASDLLTAVPATAASSASKAGGKDDKKDSYAKLLDQWAAANKGATSTQRKTAAARRGGLNIDDSEEREQEEEDALVDELVLSGADSRAMTAGDTEAEIERKAMWLTEQLLASSSDKQQTNAMTSGIVQYIVGSWRAHFSKTVAMKFNCFFLMPFMADFPEYLRNELHKLGEDASEMFDLTETRRSILARRTGLQAECNGIELMQKRFTNVQAILKHGSASGSDASEEDQSAAGADYAMEDEAALQQQEKGSRPQGDKPAGDIRSADSVSRPKF